MNLNKVFVLGNLTRDPEMKNLPSGQSVTSFGIATNRFFTDKSGQKQQQVEYHNIVLFGKLAETAKSFLNKGSLVLIEGRLQTRSWDDSAGVKHYKTEIVGKRIQLGPKKFQGASQSTIDSDKPQNQNPSDNIPIIEEDSPPNVEDDREEEIDVNDIPL